MTLVGIAIIGVGGFFTGCIRRLYRRTDGNEICGGPRVPKSMRGGKQDFEPDIARNETRTLPRLLAEESPGATKHKPGHSHSPADTRKVILINGKRPDRAYLPQICDDLANLTSDLEFGAVPASPLALNART